MLILNKVIKLFIGVCSTFILKTMIHHTVAMYIADTEFDVCT